MQTISHYWVNKDERATLAQQHLQNVRANYAGTIETSIRRAQIYTRKPGQEIKTSSFFTQTVPQDRSMNLMHFQNCFGGLT